MKLNTIAIVGGGTAGCISALVLKRRFPSLDIRIIESEKIGIVGVGEGTTEQWEDFVEYVGLDHREDVFRILSLGVFRTLVIKEKGTKNINIVVILNLFNHLW